MFHLVMLLYVMLCVGYNLYLFRCLGSPVIKTDTSKVSGTSLYLEWEIAKATDSVDFFVVEICTLHQKNAFKKTAKFKEVFRGLRTNLELKDLPYNNKVMCRVFAVNFKGGSEPSDVFEGQTVRGNHFYCYAVDSQMRFLSCVCKLSWLL